MPPTRQTHTYALLEVSPSTYNEIAEKLKAAGYGHAFIDGNIDMNGIGLVAERAAADLCTVCRVNFVDTAAGYDTCSSCARRV